MKIIALFIASIGIFMADAASWPSSAEFEKPVKLGPHLYSIKFKSYDFGYGSVYHTRLERAIAEAEEHGGGGCSVCRRGNFVGRNLDWTYDETDEFLIRVDAIPGVRHASIGVVTSSVSIPGQPMPNGTEVGKEYEILPFYTMDGINDAGVFCECNLMPWGDEPNDRGTNLDDPTARRICQGGVVRFVLDYADSARHAVELLKRVAIRSLESDPLGWMIADAKDTFVLEIIDNRLNVIEGEKARTLTNFYLSKSPVMGRPYAKYAEGIERYDRLSKAGGDIATSEAMLGLMKKEFYSQMYLPGNELRWWSEMNATEYRDEKGEKRMYSLSDNPDPGSADFRRRMEEFASDRADFARCRENERRTGIRESIDLWHTIHSAAYDLEKKTLLLRVQEQDKVYSFSL